MERTTSLVFFRSRNGFKPAVSMELCSLGCPFIFVVRARLAVFRYRPCRSLRYSGDDATFLAAKELEGNEEL
jgi:hypothetical protein